VRQNAKCLALTTINNYDVGKRLATRPAMAKNTQQVAISKKMEPDMKKKLTPHNKNTAWEKV